VIRWTTPVSRKSITTRLSVSGQQCYEEWSCRPCCSALWDLRLSHPRLCDVTLCILVEECRHFREPSKPIPAYVLSRAEDKEFISRPFFNTWLQISVSNATTKLKLHVVTVHTSDEGVWGIRGVAACILKLNSKWRWMVGITNRQLYPRGKSRRRQLNRSLGVSLGRSGRFVERNIFCPNREPNNGHFVA